MGKNATFQLKILAKDISYKKWRVTNAIAGSEPLKALILNQARKARMIKTAPIRVVIILTQTLIAQLSTSGEVLTSSIRAWGVVKTGLAVKTGGAAMNAMAKAEGNGFFGLHAGDRDYLHGRGWACRFASQGIRTGNRLHGGGLRAHYRATGYQRVDCLARQPGRCHRAHGLRF